MKNRTKFVTKADFNIGIATLYLAISIAFINNFTNQIMATVFFSIFIVYYIMSVKDKERLLLNQKALKKKYFLS